MTLVANAPSTNAPSPDEVAAAVLAALGDTGRRGLAAMPCPFHRDDRPSLLIASRAQRVRCAAGCFGGRWITPKVLLDKLGVSRSDAKAALEALPERSAPTPRDPGSSPQRTALSRVLSVLGDRVAKMDRIMGAHPWSGQATAWVVSRGYAMSTVSRWLIELDNDARRYLRHTLPAKTLVAAGVLYENGRWWATAEWGLLLVYRDQTGAPVWAQAIGLTERARALRKYKNPIEVPPVPFGLDTLGEKTRVVVVTEGATDAMSVFQHQRYPGRSGRLVHAPGSVAVIGLPGAEYHDDTWMAALQPEHRVMVGFDADETGDRAAKRLITQLAGRHITVERWRPDAKDLNKQFLALDARRS